MANLKSEDLQVIGMSTFQETYLKHFDSLIAEGKALPEGGYVDSIPLGARLVAWENRCLNLIEKTFGVDSDYYESLKGHFNSGNPIAQRMCGLEILSSAKKDYETLSPVIALEEQQEGLEPLIFLQRLCSRFHLVARQLRERYNERHTLDINDEYDVQDLMHALLKINFENIRKEEWTPSYAGASSRMDFLLKNEGIVVESKKTREGLNAKALGDQIIIDIEKYQSHPDCKMLLCFVYDPEGRLASPETLELDLGKPHGNIEVKVIVAPKGT